MKYAFLLLYSNSNVLCKKYKKKIERHNNCIINVMSPLRFMRRLMLVN